MKLIKVTLYHFKDPSNKSTILIDVSSKIKIPLQQIQIDGKEKLRKKKLSISICKNVLLKFKKFFGKETIN